MDIHAKRAARAREDDIRREARLRKAFMVATFKLGITKMSKILPLFGGVGGGDGFHPTHSIVFIILSMFIMLMMLWYVYEMENVY
jgi:hypothetical protein